ncbi:capsular polysaccharide export protein [Ciceribacter lividus]|uniref:Capsular polysaccharide export protein n=1 Tax=Ciceribacter lividus TaxID=1197950 RepID=A0A6I7HP98_9HYPH|nr:capsular biosynthesis protein [Ciceribacter lividus]RCW25901.1 capsular polysaccharide export protein [Ciceribacter lividus]
MHRLTLLILQGPASPFLKEVAREAEALGARVFKINFCLGDTVFWWPRKADWFAGPSEDWPGFLHDYLRRNDITDILMLGDGRPKHAAAVEAAREAGARVHILEHGYLRPDWLTIEPEGMSGRSWFPRDASALRALADGMPAVDLRSHFSSSFLTYALYDLAYHIPNVLLGWLLHPHYRTHGPVHPAVEYAGWIRKGLTSRRRRRQAQEVQRGYLPKETSPPRYFLFPLQLPGDYQIRIHAPFGDHFEIVAATIASFAREAPLEARLLFKIHPIDNGLSGWTGFIAGEAKRYGVDNRVDVIDGGDLEKLITSAAGIVTVNSTVGLSAVMAGKPVITLGAAIYDIAGVTHQDSLASFWRAPQAPQAGMPQVLAKALVATTQVRGGFLGAEAIAIGARNVVERILEPSPALERPSAIANAYRYQPELERAPVTAP